MHVSAKFKAIAFLSAPFFIPALGALTTEQITVGLQGLTSDINNVNNYAESLNLLDADLDTDKLVSSINSVTNSVESYNSELPGTPAQTQDEQIEIVEAIVPFTNALESLFDTLDGEVRNDDDFLLPPDDSAVDNAADSLSNSAVDTISSLAALGTTIAESGDAHESDFVDAREKLDQDAANDQLTKKFRFRRH